MNFALPSTLESQAKDWLAITLRWLALLEIGVALAARGSLFFLPALALAGAALMNLALSFLAFTGIDPRARKVYMVALDLLFAGVILFAAGPDALIWPGLLPLATGTIYFGWRGLLILLPVLVGLQALRLRELANPSVSIGWALAPYLVFSVVVYFLDKGLSGWLKRSKARLDANQESQGENIELMDSSPVQDLEIEKQRLLAIQEEVRKKLARDLHDGPTQSVAALALRVNIARRTLEKDGQTAVEELVKVEELARRTTKDIRHVLFLLRPMVFESQGLVSALESLATMMGDAYQVKISFQADPNAASSLDTSEQTLLFYLTEEAVNIARKYAGASNIWVRLREADRKSTLLEVEDDGESLVDRNALSENGVSLGQILEEMCKRAALIAGSLDYQAGPGRGNHLDLFIPGYSGSKNSNGQAWLPLGFNWIRASALLLRIDILT